MVPILARAMDRKKNLRIIFFIICRYLNLVKNQRIILKQMKNSQVVTTLKSCTDYGTKCVLLSLNFALEGPFWPQ